MFTRLHLIGAHTHAFMFGSAFNNDRSISCDEYRSRPRSTTPTTSWPNGHIQMIRTAKKVAGVKTMGTS